MYTFDSVLFALTSMTEGGGVNRQKKKKIGGTQQKWRVPDTDFFRKDLSQKIEDQPPGRIELPTPGLQDQCSNH